MTQKFSTPEPAGGTDFPLCLPQFRCGLPRASSPILLSFPGDGVSCLARGFTSHCVLMPSLDLCPELQTPAPSYLEEVVGVS